MGIRIGIASFMQESNSFAPRLAELSDFDVRAGGDLLDFFSDTNSEVAGFLDGCRDMRWEPIPLFTANASSGGPVSTECFESLCSRLVSSIEAQPIDGLLLALHGAMTVEHRSSGDTEIVRRVRRALGRQIPIAVSHDLHANLTSELLRYVNGLIGYRTYPHVDQRETARRACSILARLIAGDKSRHWYLPIPLLLSPQAASTSQQPLRAVMDRLATEFPESEGQYATLFCVQPWLDFDPVASSLAVTQFGSHPGVMERMREAAAHLWALRREFNIEWVSPENLVGGVSSNSTRPILISEATDAPTAGGSGDHTGLLECLLPSAESVRACIYLVDPEFAKRAHAAGVGAEIEGEIGAKLDARYSRPISIRASVERLSDGSFTAKGPAFHGRKFCMGETAVLKIRRLRIVAASKPVMMIDPELYRSQGVNPEDQDAVGVKSPLLFRAAYNSISNAVLHLDMPGPCRGRLERVEFNKIGRPIYPVDDFEWDPPTLQPIDTV